MIRHVRTGGVFAGVLWALVAASSGVSRGDDDELSKRSSWSAPSAAQVRAELEIWLASRSLDEATKRKIVSMWPEAEGLEGPELLDRVVESAAVAAPAIREWVAAVHADVTSDAVLKSPLLADEQLPGVVRDNLKLYVGRRLTQRSLYDEALEVFAALEPNQVADPASLLFYQSVAYHRLLQKDKCLPVLARLLENEQAIPRRYLTLARLMDADLRRSKPTRSTRSRD